MRSSFKFDWHRAVSRSALSDVQKSVAFALWDYTTAEGRNAHPGNKLLAAVTGKSLITIKRQLKALREDEWITRTTESNRHPDRTWADSYDLYLTDDRVSQLRYPVGEQRDQDRVSQSTDRVSDEADRVSQLRYTNRSSTTDPLHHSETSVSGSPPGDRANSPPEPESDFEELELWLSSEGVGVQGIDGRTAAGMWESGVHPYAILNTLRKKEAAT
ncbi:hypothetical protein D6T63_04230 [Arthrobacter cheniae]|uniref:Helix-turn-helix domain-containing protein n=1 Tax=Arthrobacter cheniae TaxID=1258888 RepID=A0A3A5M4F5_9MICC|nr:hypothetical protein [Arthrobacter cheniae]RJT81962.1 hypothetical protein D6T63_04230 [Arthrobacter cheniae]